MAFISYRTVEPMAGKSTLAAERVRDLGGIYARHGARVRVARIVGGAGAGQLVLASTCDDAKGLARTYEGVDADPAYAKLMQEQQLNPAGTITAREVYRTVHGQGQPGSPVIVMREYAVARDKMAGIIALLPDLDAVIKGHNIGLMCVVPVFSDDMSRMVAVYYLRSVADLGAVLDGVAQSPEFLSIVARAAEFGSLVKSRVVVNV
jgi:hypothetical protein